MKVIFGPRFDDMSATFHTDGAFYPAKGVMGGKEGEKAFGKILDGEREIEIPLIGGVVKKGEVLVGQNAGGGGYGNPLNRDPELVRRSVQDGLLGEDAARENTE